MAGVTLRGVVYGLAYLGLWRGFKVSIVRGYIAIKVDMKILRKNGLWRNDMSCNFTMTVWGSAWTGPWSMSWRPWEDIPSGVARSLAFGER